MKYDVTELEKEAVAVCQDFAAFCLYVSDDQVKISKNTGNIGKKDCFALNTLFHVKEAYEKATRLQSQYPVISFFYYVAVKYNILQINETRTALRKGKNYNLFQEASTWEQYTFLVTIFLFDGRFTVQESYWVKDRIADMWKWYVDAFMRWFYEEKPRSGKRCRLSMNSQINYLYKLGVITPYLEEFNLIKVWNRADDEKMGEEYWWGIEVLPMLEVVSDLYENVAIDEENIEDTEDLIQYSYEAYMDRLMPEQRENGLARIFEKAGTLNAEKTIDLEVEVRYTTCVRVIRMNITDTLYDLHRMIQKAVAFDDDHLYEFTIGKGMFKKVYVSPDIMTSGNEKSAMNVSLSDLELYKGQTFSYLFDFGDMWWFDIKVLDIQDGFIDKPEVIREINDAPIQYPDYD